MRGHDPKLERLVQEGLKHAPEPQAPPQLAQSDVWMITGNCPQCGAPIWAIMAVPASSTPPRSSYSCHCAMLVARQASVELAAFEERQRRLAPPEPVNGSP